MNSGIYQIKNLINTKLYIGSSVNITNRKSTHFTNLLKNSHHNKHLQSSYNKYGKENFVFEIIEYCEVEALINREQYWIDLLHPQYNKRAIAESNLGASRPDVAIRNIRAKELGLLKGENHPMYGKTHTEESRKKMSNSLEGKSHSLERRERRKEFSKGEGNSFFNKKHSDETKWKMKMSKKIKKIMEKGNKYVERLVREFQEHGRLLLAIDFDSTLKAWKTISNDEDMEKVISLVRRVQDHTHNIIFTSCDPKRYGEIREHCASIGVRIDVINQNAIEGLPYGHDRKPLYNILLDDRAGLLESMDILETAYYIHRGELQNNKPLTEIG